MIKRTLYALLFLTLSASAVFAYSGTYTVDQVWSTSQYVTGDITISNCTVTIDPGVTLTATGNFYIRVINATGKLVALGTSVNPITFTSETGGSNTWLGLYIENQGQMYLQSCTVNGAFWGIKTNGVSTQQDRVIDVQRCIIKNGTYGAYIDRTTARNNCIFRYNNITEGNTYAMAIQVRASCPDMPIIEFNNFTGVGSGGRHVIFTTYAGGPVSLNAEFNYYPTGTGSMDTNVDFLPQMQATATGYDSGTAANPLYIQGGAGTTGECDFSHDLLTNTYYRVNNRLTLMPTTNFTVTAGTVVNFDASGAIVADRLCSLNVTGTNASPVTFNGTGATWAGVSINTGAGASFNYVNFSRGNPALKIGTTNVTFTNCLVSGNTSGLDIGITGVSIPSNNNFVANNTNITYNGAGTLTVENIYWGSNPPSYAAWAGTGIIDYEPWRVGLPQASATANSPPITPNLLTPPNLANIDVPPASYTVTGQDIGMYNGTPLRFEIEVSSTNAFLAGDILERADQTGTDAPVNPGASWNAVSYANNAIATYTPSNTSINIVGNTYYWRVRAYDPLGSASFGPWGGTVTYNRFILGSPAISLNIAASTTQAGAGDPVVYTVTVTNNSTTNTANNLTITNYMPNEVWLEPNNGNQAVCFPAGTGTAIVTVDARNGAGASIGQAVINITGAVQNYTFVPAPNMRNVAYITFQIDALNPGQKMGYCTYRTVVK